MKSLLKHLRESVARQIERLEEVPVGPAGWAAGFLSIVAVRHLLEIRGNQFPIYAPSAFYAHYMLAYLAPLLALSLVLSVCSGVRLERVLRLMLLAWGLTLLPPLVDTLAAGSHDAPIGYLTVGKTPWSVIFLRFFDPSFPLKGTTLGIRVEAAAACILGGAFVWLRATSRPLTRSLACALGVYLTALFFFTLPSLFERALGALIPAVSLASLFNAQGRVERPSPLIERTDQVVLAYLVPLTLILAAAALARARPQLLRRSVLSLARSEGWSFAIACGFGAAAGWKILDGVPQPTANAPFDLLARFAGPLALGLGGAALSMLAPGEHLPPNASTEDRLTGLVVLTASGILAASAATSLAACGAIALGAGFLARGLSCVLPRIPLLPQAASGIAALAAFLAGYSLAAGDEALVLLPSALLMATVAAGALADISRYAAGAGKRRAWFASAACAAAPLLALGVPAAVVRSRPATGAIVAVVLFSAASLAAVRVLPARGAGAIPLTGALLAFGLSISDPDQTASWRARALASPAYFIRASEKAELAGDLQAAAGAAVEAVRRAPGLGAAHNRLALVRERRGETAGAVEEFRTAAALEPKNASLQANLAAGLLEAGRCAEALPVLALASSLDPDILSVRFNRARCLDAVGKPAEAEEEFRAYLRRAEGLLEEAFSVEFAHRRLEAPSR